MLREMRILCCQKIAAERKLAMKKILSIILALSIILCFSIFAFAGKPESMSLGEVFSEETPDCIIDAAKDEIASYIFEGNENNEDVVGHNYTLCNPINLIEDGGSNHIYYFPVMKDGEIFAIFIIYDDNGDYSFQFEESMMASQLQMLREKGLLHNVRFASSDEGFFVIVNDSIIPLSPDSKIEDMKSLKIKSDDNNTVNILEPIMYI